MKKLPLVIALFIGLLALNSCRRDNVTPGPGSLIVEFDNVVGDADLQLNSADFPYVNSHSESFKVTKVMYYVTGIKLKASDGSVYQDEVKQDGSAGYYLINEADEESHEVTLENIPSGDYTEVTFTIGVDAGLLNQATVTGPLNPANGLFWNWDAGYIFMDVEGISPISPETDDALVYHVGGYKESASDASLVNNIKTVTLSFNGNKAPVRAGHKPEVHLLFDIKKFFDGSGSQVTFSSHANRQTPKEGEDIAGNIPGAFTVDHVHVN